LKSAGQHERRSPRQFSAKHLDLLARLERPRLRWVDAKVTSVPSASTSTIAGSALHPARQRDLAARYHGVARENRVADDCTT